jgi:D-psicose/D-tagatose/L-ribulose 3-epimerase
MFKFGVNTFIWSEYFSEKDLPLIERAKSLGFDAIDIGIMNPEGFPTKQVKEKVKEVGIGGEIFGAAGYLTGKPRSQQEWEWSVGGMREVALYAKSKSNLILTVESVNRFETHFLNIAEDAVKYCKDVGTGNVKAHLDSYHMMREETNFTKAVEVCGKDYLGYVHVCENNRGIPGTGLVPWKEFFTALKKVGYEGPLTIEAFDPSFEDLNKITGTWRHYTETGEELAIQGLRNLKEIEKSL